MAFGIFNNKTNAKSDDSFEDLDIFIKNMNDIDPSDVVIISDFMQDNQKKLLKQIANRGIPVTIYNLKYLIDKARDRVNEPCPMFNVPKFDNGSKNFNIQECSLKKEKPTSGQCPEVSIISDNDIYIRKQLIPVGKSYPLIYVWMSSQENLRSILNIFGKTFLNCIQKFDHGIYHPKTKFFFIGSDKYDKKIIFSGDPIPKSVDPEEMYANYFGSDISALQTLSNVMNYSLKIKNPVKKTYSRQNEKGAFQGLVGDVANNISDMSISSIMLNFERLQVVEGMGYGTNFFTFAAPLPGLLSKSWAIILPFELNTWVYLIVFLIIFCVLLWLICNIEEIIKGGNHPDWSVFRNCMWYCFGTFMGESITRDTELNHVPATRCFLLSWILLIPIISYSYAGNLKSFLTRFLYEAPINTIKDVVESGKPCYIIDYGGHEAYMASSSDPNIRKLWNNRKIWPTNKTEKMGVIYKNKSILVDAFTNLELIVPSFYTMKNGMPMVNVFYSQKLVPELSVGFIIQPKHTWLPTFKYKVDLCLETGLFEYWKKNTTWEIISRNKNKIEEIQKNM